MSIKFYAGQYSFTMILHYQSYKPSLCKERDLYVNCLTTEPMNHDVKPAVLLPVIPLYVHNIHIGIHIDTYRYTSKFLYTYIYINIYIYIIHAFYSVPYNK